MFSLIHRAEEAFLGALLSGAAILERPHVSAEDFSLPARSALFRRIRAVRDPAASSHGTPPAGDALIDDVAHAPGQPGEPEFTPSDLRLYRDACPNPAHAADYGRIVAIGAFRLGIMRRAEVFAALLRDAPDGPDAERIRRRRDALYRQARRDDLTTQTVATRRTFAQTVLPPRPGALALSADPRARREEQLLAQLLRDPAQARAVAPILPADALTDTRRQEIYRTILDRAAAGDAVDGVLIAWHMEQQRDPAAFHLDDLPDRLKGHEADFAYLRGLADTPDSADPVWDIAVDLSVQDYSAAPVPRVRQPAEQEPASAARPRPVAPAVRGESHSPPRPVLDSRLNRPPAQAPAPRARPQP